MNIHSCCMACLIGQIEKAYNLIRPNTPNDQVVAVQKQAMLNLASLKNKRMPYYGKTLYQTFNHAIGMKDPYAEIKQRYNQKALKLLPQLKRYVTQSKNPLQTAVSISILGNTIDFGTPHTIDLEKEVAEFSLNQLAINDFSSFARDIENATKILIIADNCGECVFDMVLLEYLHEHFSNKSVFYAVRGGPVINDCTKADIKPLNLEKYCTILESSPSPGVILEESSKDFQLVFQTADLILSKGQGNFEALDDIIPENGSLYFLLKAKCKFVATLLNVKLGSLNLCAQTSIP